jgi:hypothetical protein
MPTEIALAGLYFPELLVLAAGAALFTWIVDRVLLSVHAYDWLWHPPLVRLSLFTCLVSALAMTVYR